MTVKKPEELKQVTEDMLAGLSATEELRKEILYRAASSMLEAEDPGYRGKGEKDTANRVKGEKDTGNRVKGEKGWLRFVPAMCCCLAVLICASVLIPKITETAKPDGPGFVQQDNMYDTESEENSEESFPVINDMVAGNYVVSEEKPVLASTKINTESMKVADRDSKAGIFMNTVPDAETAASGDLQLAIADGKFYRLTGDQFDIGSLKPDYEAGTVQFTADSNELIKNDIFNGSTFLKDGTKLWFIEGMNKSFVTAEYEGKNIVFERVSIENKGLLADEKFEDIIPDFDHVVSIEFSNRESITDAEKIREIGSLLKEYATMENSGAASTGEQMILVMDNGIRYQFILDGERICSCGTWVCPEFFEYLEK